MGLLDNLLGGSFDDPRTAATLQLAQGLLSAPKAMQGLSGGLLGYSQAMQEAKQRKAAEELRALQMQQAQMQLAQSQRMAERERAQDAFRQSIPSPQFQAGLDVLAANGGVTQAGAAKVPKVDPNAELLHGAMRAGLIDPVQYIAQTKPQQAKIKEFREVRMPDGSVQIVGLDEYGKPVDTGRTPFKAEEVRDFGGFVGGIDPITGKARKIGNKTMTPGEVASNELGWANTRVARERLNLEREAAGAGKAPMGYRFKADGSLEAIPGGPADIKAGELGAKAEAKKQSTISQANSVLDTIQEARGLVGFNTAGFGSMLTKVPTSDARNLQAKLETIKANLGFDRLQQMRDQSPTGGALGAVAVQELTALQSTVASLDQAQSPAQLDAALRKIDGHYSNWLKAMGAERKRGAPQDPKAIMEEADAIIRGGL